MLKLRTALTPRRKPDDRGAVAIEYGLLVMLISAAIVAALIVLGPTLGGLFKEPGKVIAAAGDGTGGPGVGSGGGDDGSGGGADDGWLPGDDWQANKWSEFKCDSGIELAFTVTGPGRFEATLLESTNWTAVDGTRADDTATLALPAEHNTDGVVGAQAHSATDPASIVFTPQHASCTLEYDDFQAPPQVISCTVTVTSRTPGEEIRFMAAVLPEQGSWFDLIKGEQRDFDNQGFASGIGSATASFDLQVPYRQYDLYPEMDNPDWSDGPPWTIDYSDPRCEPGVAT